MASGDHSGTYVLTIRITNTNPTVISAFTVQVASYSFPAQVIDHPSLGILTRSGAQLGRIDAVQSYRGAINNDCVGISDVCTARQSSCCEDERGSGEKAFHILESG